MSGTNLNAKLTALVKVSLTDDNGKATDAECVGDPNTVALETNTYALGCTMRRSDLSSGAVLYVNQGNTTTPQWYLVTAS